MPNELPPLPPLPPLPKLPKLPKLPDPTKVKLPDPMAAMRRPSDPIEDPLKDLEYTGDAETDLKNELTAAQQAYRDRAEREKDRYKHAVDGGFYFCVYFNTSEEREAFLIAAGDPPVELDYYIDGRDLAYALGITYPHQTT